MTVTLHEEQCTFFIISCWIPLRMRSVLDKCCRENQNRHFVLNTFFLSKNHAACKIMWKKYCIARQATDNNIIWCMHMACWIPKAANTHSECVILIALLVQQWLHKHVSMLRYTYIALIVHVHPSACIKKKCSFHWMKFLWLFLGITIIWFCL